MERQARRLLEMELSKQPDILLMERQDLEKVRREQHLSGDLDTGFQAASGFVDARLDMNHSRDGIRAIHLRFDPKKGPARVAHVVCGEQSIHEALQQAIAELFTQSENTSREVSADTYQDYERLFKEARWLNKVGLHRESLRYIRNAVALHDKDRRVWSLYLESLRETFPKPSKAGDLFDAKNFERVISHERERLLVLDRLYRIYLEEGKGRPFLFVKGHDDFGYTLATLNMVTLRRKYKESIRLLEEEYLKLVRRRVIPLFSLYKTRGYRRTDSDLHLGKTLKNLRNFKTVAPERLESIVKELVVAHSVQYTDPEYWPNDSHRQFSYSGVPYRDLPYGENLDDNITDWVIAYACPYIGHEFLQNIFRGHWMGTLKKSRKYINERVEESKNLRKKMSFRQRLLKRFMSGLHYGNYRGWMSGDVIMPKIDELKLDMARVWQPPDRVAIGLIGHLSEDSKLSLNVTKEFFGLEKDPVQLQVTRRMLERFSKEDSWLNQRSSNIEKKLESLIAAAEKGDRVTTKDSSLSIGKFHVSVWHPETYGYGDFRLMHTPVLFNNTWYVLATNGRPSRHKTNDYLLFTIHSETFETHAKRFNSPHFPRHSISDVALNEDWLFFCPDEFAPITCLKLEDLTTHTIKNVRGDASGPDGFVVRGKYYAMVTPLDDLKNRSLQPKERTHLLMEYDPSRRALKILVNSRRNPAVTVIDEIIPHVFAMQYSESHDSIVFHATTRRLKAYSLALDSQEATRIEGEFEAKWRLYLDEEMTEAYRKVGIIDSSGSHWFKSTGISGEWRKFVSPNSIVLTSRESPSRFQHKAVEFIPSYTGLSDPDLQAVNKEFMGERNRARSTLRFNTRAGCFLVGENGVAFFKTSDLGRALAVSDILPRR